MLIWVAVILIVFATGAWAIARRNHARVALTTEQLAAATATGIHNDLPPLLEAYVDRVGLAANRGRRWFRLNQTGEMRLRPDGDWISFTATQVYSVAEPAFVWNARFRWFHVIDSLVAGNGSLDARLLGVLPVMTASGKEARRAQMLRYLAEVAWVPSAFTGNRFASWQQVSDTEVIASLSFASERVELRYHFDERGDIARVEGERERAVGKLVVLTPWTGRFFDYETVGGVRIPTRGEVAWRLDSGPSTYWRGAVADLSCG